MRTGGSPLVSQSIPLCSLLTCGSGCPLCLFLKVMKRASLLSHVIRSWVQIPRPKALSLSSPTLGVSNHSSSLLVTRRLFVDEWISQIAQFEKRWKVQALSCLLWMHPPVRLKCQLQDIGAVYTNHPGTCALLVMLSFCLLLFFLEVLAVQPLGFLVRFWRWAKVWSAAGW